MFSSLHGLFCQPDSEKQRSRFELAWLILPARQRGNILSIIGCFLPFIPFWGINAPYIDGDGVFVLVLCLVSIVLAFIKAKFAFIANILALLVTFVGISNAAEFSLKVLGIGAYVIVIANIVAIIGSIKSKKA